MEELNANDWTKFLKAILCIRRLCGLGLGQTLTVFGFFVLTISTIVIFGIFVILVFFSLYPAASNGLFTGVFNIYFDINYNLTITPAEFAFYVIWGLTFVLLGIFLAYVLLAFFLQTPDGQAITSPPVITPIVLIAMDAGFIVGAFWLFTFDNAQLGLALFFNTVAVFFFLIAAGVLAYRFSIYRSTLTGANRSFEAAVILFAGLNGLTMLIAWLVYLGFVNFSYVLSASVTDENASVIALVSLGILIAAYFLADITVLELYTRFVLAPYIVMAIALVASILQNFVPANLSTTINVALVAMVIAAGLAKLAVSIYLNANFAVRRGDKSRIDYYNVIDDADLPLKKNQVDYCKIVDDAHLCLIKNEVDYFKVVEDDDLPLKL